MTLKGDKSQTICFSAKIYKIVPAFVIRIVGDHNYWFKMSCLSSSRRQVAVLTLDIHHRHVHVTSRSVIRTAVIALAQIYYFKTARWPWPRRTKIWEDMMSQRQFYLGHWTKNELGWFSPDLRARSFQKKRCLFHLTYLFTQRHQFKEEKLHRCNIYSDQ